MLSHLCAELCNDLGDFSGYKKACRVMTNGDPVEGHIFYPTLAQIMVSFYCSVNVYVDLLVFMRIGGTS